MADSWSTSLGRYTSEAAPLVARDDVLEACVDLMASASMDALVLCDADDNIISCNAAAARTFSCEENALRGLCVDELLTVEGESKGNVCLIVGRRHDGSTFAGEMHLAEVATPVPMRCYVIRDVSERTQLEAQLRQAQKMDALGQLAGGVAHDFNNLLTVIFGNLDLARREVRDRPSTMELLVEVERASTRAAELTRQLLSFSRKRVLEPRVLSIDSLVRNAERLLRRVLPESIVLETSLGADPVAVRSDPGQLEQALVNLVVNARDAMPAGGTITIESSVVTLNGERHDIVPEARPGRYVALVVRDTGSGMTEDVLPRIFEPFFTTKAVGQGTGLGLPMVYGIVTQSGGALLVESAPGAGTSFTMFLPAVDGATPLEAATRRTALRGSETILLVEDEAAVRVSTRRMLERHGYTVLEARHGGDALAIWRAERSRIRLIISDVRMPAMGGADMVQQVRRDAPELPVLLMSGYAETDASPHLYELGVPFIEKPFTADALLQRVREMLDGA